MSYQRRLSDPFLLEIPSLALSGEQVGWDLTHGSAGFMKSLTSGYMVYPMKPNRVTCFQAAADKHL